MSEGREREAFAVFFAREVLVSWYWLMAAIFCAWAGVHDDTFIPNWLFTVNSLYSAARFGHLIARTKGKP